MVSTLDHGESERNPTGKIVSYEVGNRASARQVMMIGRQVPDVEYAPRELLCERDGVNIHRQTLTSNKLSHLSQL